MQSSNKDTFQAWLEQEKKALELISIVGDLRFNKSTELILFRRPLFDEGTNEVLSHHLFAEKYTEKPITVEITTKIAKAIQGLDLAPSRIDLGRLASEWISKSASYNNDVEAFVQDKLKAHIGKDKLVLKSKDVVLYGFGRIGRLAARILVAEAGDGNQLRLKAIVIRQKLSIEEELAKRATLLRKDSIHGRFHGTIVEDVASSSLIINGHPVKIIFSNDPTTIDYTAFGINDALLIDNTGVLKDEAGLSKHLQSKGIKQVILTAPAKGEIPNIVYGVNHLEYNRDLPIYSAASCTTNAVVPIIKTIHDVNNIISGHLETVHAYTNDQNLIDNFHKSERRGRSAALNMVITSTGAASAVGKVMPELKGKLTGSAVRVPVPNVSLAILNLNLTKATNAEELNSLLKQAALSGNLCEQIDYSTSKEYVSSDGVGNPHPSIIDAPATKVSIDGKSAIIYAWYDNEFGYTKQVIRLAKYIAGVIRLTYY
jgi:glyceraldehyde 3-phosphate dehydrogenase